MKSLPLIMMTTRLQAPSVAAAGDITIPMITDVLPLLTLCTDKPLRFHHLVLPPRLNLVQL
jgi:hypothetical protein